MDQQAEGAMARQVVTSRTPWRRLLIAVALLGVLGLVAGQLGLFDLLEGATFQERVERLDRMFQSLGGWAPALFIR